MQQPELHATTWIHDESTIAKHLIPTFSEIYGSVRLPSRSATTLDTRLESGLSGKTIANVIGLMRKALADALDEDLISRNPIRRTSARRLGVERRRQVSADPFTPAEIANILKGIPLWYRELYAIWFRVGWRPSEIVAMKFGWLDFEQQTILVRSGRTPRWGALNVNPRPASVGSTAPTTRRYSRRSPRSTRERAVRVLPISCLPTQPDRRSRRSGSAKKSGSQLSRSLGFASAGNTAFATVLSPSRFPQVRTLAGSPEFGGTSEQMIFQHYRRYIDGLQNDEGKKISKKLSLPAIAENPTTSSPDASPTQKPRTKTQQLRAVNMVEAGGIEPPSEDLPVIVTTRLFRDLISSAGRPRTGCPSTSRLKFRRIAQPTNRDLLAH